jgi:hypothetical protein
MDTTTSHILLKLDAIERAIGDLRREISVEGSRTNSASPRKRRLPVPKLSPFWQSIAAGGVIWSIGLACKAYLDNGGKPLDLIEAVLKLAL